MTMHVQTRRVVERETNIAATGFGVAYFPDNGNTYFVTRNNAVGAPMVTRSRSDAETLLEHQNPDIIDLTLVRGTQE
ncbi:hypothetical protein LINPERHAP1_LOCUS26764 [Linum perenne]